MTVLAGVAARKKEYREAIFPFLLDHLRTCRANEVLRHAKSISCAADEERKQAFLNVLKLREPELSENQKKCFRNYTTNI